MNWYDGSIADSIKLAKERSALFVVYVKRDNEETIENFFISALNTEKFVCIQIANGSQHYEQFSQIYKVDKLPSLFVIGENGKIVRKFTDELSEPEAVILSLKKIISNNYHGVKVVKSIPITSSMAHKKEDDKNSASESKEHECAITKILFKTPDGGSFKENFNSKDTLEILINCVNGKLLIGKRNKVVLSTVFPKKEFEMSDYCRTLKELNLCPSAVIYVKVKMDDNNSVNKFSTFNLLNYVFTGLLGILSSIWSSITAKFSSSTNHDSNSIQTRNKILKRFDQSGNNSSGSSNIRTLNDSKNKDGEKDDDNNTYNGNSTQQK